MQIIQADTLGQPLRQHFQLQRFCLRCRHPPFLPSDERKGMEALSALQAPFGTQRLGILRTNHAILDQHGQHFDQGQTMLGVFLFRHSGKYSMRRFRL
ncbi:MAG: hypothetical protein BWY57_01876 [Betaproteobacteria bacterium ADurb.Bin341]|nr:MAG: hypothetical protein BWY57_01876 [Betaproteobacteria bacterium ADurb.Bin341]